MSVELGAIYKPHPLAELFPPLAPERFDELCRDIERHGLLNPIVLHAGLVLDGMNRLSACEKLGIAPAFTEFESLRLRCTPEEYIWAQNITRRHLSDDQRAAIVLQFAERLKAEARDRQKAQAGRGAEGGRGKKKTLVADSPQGLELETGGKTRHKLAELAHVTQHRVRQAEKVRAASTELLGKVAHGEINLRQATRQVQRDTNAAIIAAGSARSKTSDASNSGRPGWTVWGLEAGVGRNVLPLECGWSTSPRGLVQSYAKAVEILGGHLANERKHIQYLFEASQKERLQEPALLLDNIAEVVEAAENIIRKTGKELAVLAAEYSAERTARLPDGLGPDRDRFLEVNRQQKNGRGYCGTLGCWRQIQTGSQHCEEHSKQGAGA